MKGKISISKKGQNTQLKAVTQLQAISI